MFCVPMLETQMQVVFSNFPNAGRGVAIYKYKHNFFWFHKQKTSCFVLH